MATATVTPSLFFSTSESSSSLIDIAFDSDGILTCSNFSGHTIVKIISNNSSNVFVNENTNRKYPVALAFDSSRNLFCTFSSSNIIAKITPEGNVTNFLSNSPVNVGLNKPTGLVFDSLGNLYCANHGNSRILKITPGGSVTTFFDLYNNPTISTNIFNNLYDITIDSLNNLYCSLYSSNKILKITPAGIVSEFVTTGIDGPTMLTFDSVGNLYCSSSLNNRIIRIDTNGNPIIFASSTAEHPLNNPRGLAFDSSGNLYVANYIGKNIRKYTITKVVTNLSNFGNINKLPGDASFNLSNPTTNSPGAFTFSSSNPAVATISGSTVTIVGVGETTITATQAETTDYTSASITATLQVGKNTTTLGVLSNINKTFGDANFSLSNPSSDSMGEFAYDSSNTEVATISGNIVTIVGAGETTITVTQAETSTYYSASTSFTLTVAKSNPSFASPSPSLLTSTPSSSGPIGLAIDNEGNIYSSYYDSNAIVKVSPTGTISTIISSGLNKPNGLVFDSCGNLYCANHGGISSPGNSSIIKINPNVSPVGVTTILTNSPDVGLFRAQQLAFDSLGNLYCACYGSNKILKITPENDVSVFKNFTTGGSYGLAFDSSDNLYCSLFEVNKIVKITSSGTTSDFLTTGLNKPAHLSFDSVGNLYCSNAIGNSITRIAPNGTATTFASSTAQHPLNNPRGTVFDSAGNLYVANYTGKNIRKYTITKILSNANKTFGDASFSLSNPSSISPGAFSFSSSDPAVATISDNNVVTILAAGETIITATQAETANYNSASTTATLTVAKANPGLASFSNINKTFGNIPFNLSNPSSNSPGALSFSSSNTAVARIENILGNNVIIVVGPGTTTITASQAETANYTAASISLTLTVLENSQSNPASINDITDLLYFVKSNASFAVLSSNVNVFTSELITSNSLKIVTSNGRVLVTRREFTPPV